MPITFADIAPRDPTEEMIRGAFRHILPQRMHDREKGYSPPLRALGGYSFVPKQEGQRGFLQPPENKARDYYPNFLMGLAPGEAEPEGLRNEPEPNRQPENRGNDKICVTDGNVKKCKMPDGRWVTLDGRLTSPPKGYH